MQKKLLITDLDNTLYDWVTFFAASFDSMVDELTKLINVPKETLLEEFKAVHQHYHNSEQPFAVLELPSLKRKFGNLTRDELVSKVDPALHRFNSIRKQKLKLYEGVAETLAELQQANVTIVGHTEATVENAYWRLRALGIERYFSRVYTLEGKQTIHVPTQIGWADPPDGFVTIVPREDRKPNPRLLADICRNEGADLATTYYLGDSMVRDVAMAKQAGVTAVWARYGTKYDPECWTYLVRITHWTDDDVFREKALKAKFRDVVPDYTIDSFSELLSIVLASTNKPVRFA